MARSRGLIQALIANPVGDGAKFVALLTGLGGCHEPAVPVDEPEPGACEPTIPTPLYPEDRCGDGVIDEYEGSLSEQCDGEAIEQTCTSLGYLGGTLGCTARCRHDASGCTICLEDPRAYDCGLAPLQPAPSWSSVAVGSHGIGMAYGSRLAGGIHFSVLGEDLAPTLPPVCLDYEGSVVDLAPVDDGWWLAVQGDGLVGWVIGLDATGEIEATRALARHFHATLDSGGSFPMLLYTDADLPEGSAASRYSVVAERLEPDGRARWRSELPFENLGLGAFSSVAVDGGYLVAVPGTPSVTLVHVAADGQVSVEDDRLREVASLALRDDDGPVALYRTHQDLDHVRFVRLDPLGRPMSTPTLLPELGLGSGTLVRNGRLLRVDGRLDGRDRLEVRRFDLDSGELLDGPWSIAELPHESSSSSSYFLGITVLDLPDPLVLWTRGDLLAGLMAARIVEG